MTPLQLREQSRQHHDVSDSGRRRDAFIETHQLRHVGE
jgi:hypothetical protein